MDSQIPFFCGDKEECLTLGHPNATRMTIESIEKNFIVVGTLDELDKTYAVFECLIPEYLRGLVSLKKRFMIKKHSKHKKVILIRDSVKNVLKKRLANEYVLYDYVKARLDRQYKECLDRKLIPPV